jgi:amidase
MRPTPGVVPNWNATNAFNPLATNGPMARTVVDVALVLSVMARPPRNAATGPTLNTAELRALVPADLRGLRVAYAPNLGGRVPVDPEVRAVIAATAGALERAGADVQPACPGLAGADDAFRVLRAAEFDADWHDLLEANPDGFVDFLADNIRQGAELSGREVMRAYVETTRLARDADSFFEDYDLVLAPAAQLPPFPVEWGWPKEVDGTPMGDYLEWMRAAWLFTPLGVPALSLPAGFTTAGLPIGAQLLARAGNDNVLLRVALAIEQALDIPDTDPFAKEHQAHE